MNTGLLDRIEAASLRGRDVVFMHGESPETVAWGELHDRARRLAGLLQSRGVAPGDRLAFLGGTSPDMVVGLQAAWLAGAAVIVLPLRTRLEPEHEFRTRTLERIGLGEVSYVLCDEDLAGVVDSGGNVAGLVLSEMCNDAIRSKARYDTPADDPERTAILQFTSGSTSDPKGVVIPQRCLLDNLDAVVDRAPLDVDDDVLVSWLPLYHDMGLVYVLSLAMTTGAPLVLGPPGRFISSPTTWMEWMHEFGGTWTIGPNFALTMSARLLARAEKLDLGRCRRLGSGSEPVDPAVMDAMAAAGKDHNLDSGVFYAGYGMAEATVAVSFSSPGTGFDDDVVDNAVLEHEARAEPVPPGAPSARRLARCGPPLRGFEVRIADPDSGALLPDRGVGEIELRGPSVVPGYYKRPDATAAAFRDGGWLRTGDLGYQADGDLVVCGRIKDMIIVGGRNVFPEDLERPVQTVEGVRAGNVIAFGIEGGRKGDAVVVVAEVKAGEPDQIRDDIARAVGHAAGVRLDDIVLLPPGSLPKTSSGKLRRSACRARYQASELESL